MSTIIGHSSSIHLPPLDEWYFSGGVAFQGSTRGPAYSAEQARASYYLDNVPKVWKAPESPSFASENIFDSCIETRIKRLEWGRRRNEDFCRFLRWHIQRDFVGGTAFDYEAGLPNYRRMPWPKSSPNDVKYWNDVQRARAAHSISLGVPPGEPDSIAILHMDKLAGQLLECGTELSFNAAGELVGGYFCGNKKACPICARKKAGKAASRLYDRVLSVMAQNPSLRLVMAVFTAPNGSDLLERTENILRGFKGITDIMRDSRRTLRHSECSKIAGGVASVEVKRGGDSGLWHPHAHALLLVSDYIDQAKLSQEWCALTGGIRVFLKEIGGILPDKKELPPDFLEVVKYSLKLGDLSFGDNLRAVADLQGRRLLKTFGNLWGCGVEDEGDIREKTDAFNFRWHPESRGYLPV